MIPKGFERIRRLRKSEIKSVKVKGKRVDAYMHKF